jgi:hypothetical protein
LTSNDLLLNLDQRAAGAAGREHDIGEEVALDVVLLADLETLEELEAREISFCGRANTLDDLHISNTAEGEDNALFLLAKVMIEGCHYVRQC